MYHHKGGLTDKKIWDNEDIDFDLYSGIAGLSDTVPVEIFAQYDQIKQSLIREGNEMEPKDLPLLQKFSDLFFNLLNKMKRS